MLLWSVTYGRNSCTFIFPLTLTQDNGRNGLTRQQMLTVANQLNTEMDIRSLGLELGLDGDKIDAKLNNRIRDIREIAYDILADWRKRVPDAHTALRILLDALTHPKVNLKQAASDISKSPPPISGKEKYLLSIQTASL